MVRSFLPSRHTLSAKDISTRERAPCHRAARRSGTRGIDVVSNRKNMYRNLLQYRRSERNALLQICVLTCLSGLAACAPCFIAVGLPRIRHFSHATTACHITREGRFPSTLSMSIAEGCSANLFVQRQTDRKAQETGVVQWTDYLELASARTVRPASSQIPQSMPNCTTFPMVVPEPDVQHGF